MNLMLMQKTPGSVFVSGVFLDGCRRCDKMIWSLSFFGWQVSSFRQTSHSLNFPRSSECDARPSPKRRVSLTLDSVRGFIVCFDVARHPLPGHRSEAEGTGARLCDLQGQTG